MPEGDTILRTAENVGRWLRGRTVTEASSRVSGVDLRPVVGTTIDAVEAKGKHLLIGFSSGHVLHTHMRMTGAWHLYPAGEAWRRPGWQARAMLACGERTAVCFNAPVVEMLLPGTDEAHPALAALGPDILSGHFDVDEVLGRAKRQPPQTTAGELLLDQRVVAGIGNIYRCEALFAARIDPWTPVGELDVDDVRRAVMAAARLMRTNARAGTTMDRQFGGRPGRPWVYRRAGRPCQRCAAIIRHGRLGLQPRSVYWCPSCQGSGSGGRLTLPVPSLELLSLPDRVPSRRPYGWSVTPVRGGHDTPCVSRFRRFTAEPTKMPRPRRSGLVPRATVPASSSTRSMTS